MAVQQIEDHFLYPSTLYIKNRSTIIKTVLGSCVAVCPVNWEIKNDGKSKPKKIELDEVGCNEKAAQVCPVQCIKIEKV